MAFPGWVAARVSGAKLVYDAHELIIPEPGINQSRRDRFFYLLEKWTVKRADLVIAANEQRAEHMQQHYGLGSLPLVIQNIPPTPQEVLGPERTLDEYPLLKRHPGSIRLVYQGDMSLNRGIGEFVNAMKNLEDRFELVLVGGGPDVERLRELAVAGGVKDRVILLGKVTRQHLHDVLKTCDIGIVTYPKQGLNNIYCAPNKIYEYAQAGLPMLGSENPTIRSVFDTFKVGRTCQETATDIASVSEDLDSYKANIEAFLAANSWDRQSETLRAAYLTLCDSSWK
jgi:glycosyltransferase involved in cell wall biosynthesis